MMQVSCFVLGNCQGQFIASALAGLPGWEAFAIGRRFGFDPVVSDKKPQYAALKEFWPLVHEASLANRYCLILEQVTPQAPLRQYGVREKLISQKVLFPHVQCQSLWPSRYFEPDMIDQLQPKRLLAHDLASIKKAQTKADFPVNVRDYVAEHFSTRSLFHTWGHPTGPLLAKILGGILEQIGGLVSPDQRDDLIHLVEQSNGIDNISHHPIDRAWLRDGGFEWGDYDDYARWTDAVALFKSRDYTGAVAAAKASLNAQPNNAHVHALLGQALERTGEGLLAETAFLTAMNLQPNAPGFPVALGRHLLRKRAALRAWHVAKAASERFQTDASVFHLAVDALAQAGDVEQAKTVALQTAYQVRPHAPTFLKIIDSLKQAGVSDTSEIISVMIKRMPKDPTIQALTA